LLEVPEELEADEPEPDALDPEELPVVPGSRLDPPTEPCSAWRKDWTLLENSL
jgi:hypothetical protein